MIDLFNRISIYFSKIKNILLLIKKRKILKLKHHYCKDQDFNNFQKIQEYILDCLDEDNKWMRFDVMHFLLSYDKTLKRAKYFDLARNNKEALLYIIEKIAKEIQTQIFNKNLTLRPIKYSLRYDPNSKKTRQIGIHSIKQQFCDYIAVKMAKEVWDKKIGKYQCASLPQRGQVTGKKYLEKWIKNYPSRLYASKGDIKHCYPSINIKILKKKLKDDIDNENLLYLMFTLIDTFKTGLSIGSYLSQYLCNYYLSFSYNYLDNNLKKYFYHQLWYMDDFVIIGDSKQNILYATQQLIIFLKNELDLEVKSTWEIFPFDYSQNGKQHFGKPIDMMGYVVYKDHTEIRYYIFLSARRAFQRAFYYTNQKPKKLIPLKLAQRCISYYGWFKNSNSKYFIENNHIEETLKWAKKSISLYSKILAKNNC